MHKSMLTLLCEICAKGSKTKPRHQTVHNQCILAHLLEHKKIIFLGIIANIYIAEICLISTVLC